MSPEHGLVFMLVLLGFVAGMIVGAAVKRCPPYQ